MWQGGKCRPIDNLLESGINATTSPEDTISIHTADCIIAAISERLRVFKDKGKVETTVMRTWDLKKACKQLPVHGESLNECYLAVYSPDLKRVLPFGSRASVHGFCRVGPAIWEIGCRIFKVRWSNYFDDFVVVESRQLATLTELCVNLIFGILGWTVRRIQSLMS